MSAPAADTAPHGTLLCVETSCDDTSAAMVRGRTVLASVVSSQNELHAAFGGIVPEVASRRHTELLPAVVAEAMRRAGCDWADVDAVAVTVGPGLIGALLVGLAGAKTIAYARRLPLVPVNHLQGHIAAAFAEELPLGRPPAPAEPPFVCLIASGGHTLLAVVEEGVDFRVAGRTLDDAAGEAFDKGARLLGLPYPGGAELDRLAAQGDPSRVRFPRAMSRGLDFSFSGLKTALLYYLREQTESDVRAQRADIAAGYQSALVRQLVDKAVRCAEAESLRTVAVAGGVAANSGLRAALARECERRGLRAHLPPPSLCTDNAAMIGLAAAFLPAVPWPEYLALDAYAAAAATSAPARPVRRSSSVRRP
jgi:N6-L-threonylcarbamoyladenine synthase